jgi:hypothetical protein
MTTVTEPRALARAPRRAIDWHQAAELLARGATAAAVAEQVGCSRSHLAKKRRRDPVFQNWVARCGERLAGGGVDPLTDLRRTLQEAIETEVRAGNVRVILWLADRLKLVNPPNERTPEHALREILGGLSQDELSEFEGLRDAS